MDRRFHVSFICSGNICRSPIAEKVFAREVEQAGLADRVLVTSAGTGSWHVGDPADSRAAALLAEHGYVDTHVARQVDDELLDADLLVALDAGHLRALRRIAPIPSGYGCCARSTRTHLREPASPIRTTAVRRGSARSSRWSGPRCRGCWST